MIVIDKPAGLVVHPGAGNATGPWSTVCSRSSPRSPASASQIRPGIVHRLDAGSSGLLVVARTQEAADALIEQFADHSATRRYDALVWGVPDAPHGIIDAPVGRDRGDPLKMAVVANGRFARTDYRVIGILLGARRRVAARVPARDGPDAPDPCAPGIDRSSAGRRPDVQRNAARCSDSTRPFLHAAELAFVHPATGERVTFHSPLAADLEAWLDAATP